ncbi:MAG TPA: AraD1 family protein [Vicinamibacterales bacterium]|nr:AraD1 family protein [Vicinamibacterales bacterium]
MTRVVQLQQGSTRRVARVDEPSLRLLADTESVFALAGDAIDARVPLKTLIDRRVTSECLDYDAVYSGSSPWRLLVPIDHPEPSRCLISGTGLTHLGSAESRNAMHGKSDSELTDSMRMFRMGLEGGRPDGGRIGAAPEWFYKGNGTVLRTTGDVLEVPGYAEDGGDEAEVAGVYVVDAEGRPRRIGMAAGNEFSDHKFEKRNYLNLAGSKLRTCGLGPELVIDPAFDLVPGRVSVERAGQTIWQRAIATGEREMCHTVANIEHHHFKFEAHRRPGDLHVHYYGAHTLSFADGVRLEDGDVMAIQFEGFGRPLRNAVRIAAPVNEPIKVLSIA